MSEGQSLELVGQSAIYRGGIVGLCFQKTLHRVRARADGPSTDYLQLVFRAYLHAGVFQRFASITVNIAHLTLEAFRQVPIPIPPDEMAVEVLGSYKHIRDGWLRLEQQVGKELRRASQLRQSILKRAFEGQLVPQEPNDEPASALLDRIRSNLSSAPPSGTAKHRRRSG